MHGPRVGALVVGMSVGVADSGSKVSLPGLSIVEFCPKSEVASFGGLVKFEDVLLFSDSEEAALAGDGAISVSSCSDGDSPDSTSADATGEGVFTSTTPHAVASIQVEDSSQNQSSPTLICGLKQLSNRLHLSAEILYPLSANDLSTHLYPIPGPPTAAPLGLSSSLILIVGSFVGARVAPHNPNGVVS